MAGRNRAPSQRQLRVGEELRHVISGVLARGEIRDSKRTCGFPEQLERIVPAAARCCVPIGTARQDIVPRRAINR